MLFFELFILKALLAGVGIASISGSVGCFVVWKRLAYFGDSLAHAALVGISFGLILGISVNIGILAICFVFVLLLFWLKTNKNLNSDTILGILAHAALSVGIFIFSFLERPIDLHSLLFGDILTVKTEDIILIYAVVCLVVAFFYVYWDCLMLMVINEELAITENVKIHRLQFLLMSLIALVIAVSIQIVGILLISSLLIIPAATARYYAQSPISMCFIGAFIGILSVVAGMSVSILLDTPSGPSIVLACVVLFCLTSIFKRKNTAS